MQSVDYSDPRLSQQVNPTDPITVRYDNAVHFDGDNTINDRLTAGDPFPAESGAGDTGVIA